MKSFPRSFRNLASLLLPGAMLFGCATHSAPEALPKGFLQLAGRWHKESPLCNVDERRLAPLLDKTPSGAVTHDSQKVLQVLDKIDWNKERRLRVEANAYLKDLPPRIPASDYASVMHFGCPTAPAFEAIRAVMRLETSRPRGAPSGTAMTAISHYVDAGPAIDILQILSQWSMLREMSISPYFSPRISSGLQSEMDRFADRLKDERKDVSGEHTARTNEEAYANFRENVMKAQEVQRSYDMILAKLKPIFFR